VSDYLDAHTVEDLEALADALPDWKPVAPDNVIDLDERRQRRDAEIERLAAMPTLDYEQGRRAAASSLKMRPTELDRAVTAKRPKTDKFSMTADGLSMRGDLIAQPFEIIALARDATSSDEAVAWSALIRFRNPDGAIIEAPVSKAALIKEPNVALGALADHGLNIKCTKAAKEGLAEYLAAAEPKERLILVRRAGWSSAARVFALLDDIIGGSRQ
jgi:hypothetical protein